MGQQRPTLLPSLQSASPEGLKKYDTSRPKCWPCPKFLRDLGQAPDPLWTHIQQRGPIPTDSPSSPLPVWQRLSHPILLLLGSCEHSFLFLKSNFPLGEKPDSTGPPWGRIYSSGTWFQASPGWRERCGV